MNCSSRSARLPPTERMTASSMVKAEAARKAESENIVPVTVEMVFFEWLRVAGSLEFKEVQKRLIR